MKRYALGLDYGTNSCRALIFDLEDGTELADAVFPYPSGEQGILLDPRDPNLARQNPQDYIDSLGAITAGGDMILLDSATWRAVRRWQAGRTIAEHIPVLLRFSPDGRRIMTNDSSAGMILWRIDTLEELIDWANYNRYVPDLTCEQQQRYRPRHGHPACNHRHLRVLLHGAFGQGSRIAF